MIETCYIKKMGIIKIEKSYGLHILHLEKVIQMRAIHYKNLNLIQYYEKSMLKFLSLRIQSKMIEHSADPEIFSLKYVNQKIRDYNEHIENSKYLRNEIKLQEI